MIAIDTSTWIAYFEGAKGQDVDVLDRALVEGQAAVPAPVLTELLSDSELDPGLVEDLLQLPLLEPSSGFWQRAGRLRAGVLDRKRKATLPDTLIVQLCLDHHVLLITRDRDFRVFAETSGLGLVP